jgi:hypothetical protein
LLHVRENYLETGGRPADVASLVRSAAPGVAALLRLLARLHGVRAASIAELGDFAAATVGLDPRAAGDLLHLAEGSESVDAARAFPGCLAAVARLARYVDGWHAP